MGHKRFFMRATALVLTLVACAQGYVLVPAAARRAKQTELTARRALARRVRVRRRALRLGGRHADERGESGGRRRIRRRRLRGARGRAEECGRSMKLQQRPFYQHADSSSPIR
jgi:hypothetical protein